MNHLRDPLSDEELEYLDDLLLDRLDEDAVTDGSDEGVLNVSELDGLLTAVVSGPVTIMPSGWLSAVWGDFEPTWESLQDYQTFMSIVIRHMNGIVATLMEEPEAFEAIFEERIRKGETILVVDEWCEGYMRGVGLAAEAWSTGGPEIADLLEPIRAFTEETDWRAHELPDEELDRLRDLIEPNVRTIHAYWLARRADLAPARAPLRRAAPRVGRNDPCPCGSGKKYKHCCLH